MSKVQIKANGIDIYYESHGKGEPLVLIAGYTGDHTFWRLIVDELAEQFQVIIFDNRGVGQTKDRGLSFTLDTMVEDTIALIQQLGLVRPHIIGQSMGGAIAQGIARRHADKINKLVILNSTSQFTRRSMMAVETFLHFQQENLSLDSFAESCMTWFFSSTYLSQPENIAAFKELLKNNPYPQSLADQKRQFEVLLSFDSSKWLHEIISPTLVIAAKDDIITLPTEGEFLAKGIAKAQFNLIPGGHSSPVEQVQEMNRILIKFLTS